MVGELLIVFPIFPLVVGRVVSAVLEKVSGVAISLLVVRSAEERV